ncbi:MobC family plasmid mobilization relaxosome protein [Campylobacter sp. RM16187]|uniref:MobC family plasmid mobilization relaxosome protein n=1 Tax=Campylobacter sp. RM16187 TaxID=1660063 RepID=UPI0021B6CBE3|nr:MobC family plasmid mobilization relaxosome protein [Campylobacter sp. RM16187]QKG28741.1 putative mobilization protein [Campylobacter sp. RM16187]
MKVKNNRTNRITIRLNDSEINDLELKAGLSGIGISAYIRHIILHSKPPIHKFDRTMINQLSRLGNNLNQIAKHVNISKTIDRMVLKQMLDVKKKLDNLIDKK